MFGYWREESFGKSLGKQVATRTLRHSAIKAAKKDFVQLGNSMPVCSSDLKAVDRGPLSPAEPILYGPALQ